MKKIWITEKVKNGHKNCPGCNWEGTTFYGIGRTEKDAKKRFKQKRGDSKIWGKGICGECMTELILLLGFSLVENNKRR